VSYQTLYKPKDLQTKPSVKILAIDDDPLLLSTIGLILDEQGYKVCIAEDGLKGLRSYRLEQPDLVITDLQMPVKDGLDTIKLLRTWSPQLKIIAICGGSLASNHDLLHRATELGASAVMCKPFDADQLVETVTNCLDVARSLEIPIPLVAADLMQAIAEDQLFLNISRRSTTGSNELPVSRLWCAGAIPCMASFGRINLSPWRKKAR